MNDLRERFRTLDYLPELDVWSDIEAKAAVATIPSRWRMLPALLAVALIATVLGGAAMLASGVQPPFLNLRPTASPSPTPSPMPSTALLPALGMPNYGQLRNTEPQDYGFSGQPGISSGMHNVDLDAEIVFAVEADQDGCFARGEGPAPLPTTVAGFSAVVVEPYGGDARALFIPGGDETTRAYALDVEGRTLCIYLSWGPETSSDELEAARAVLDTIRAQPNRAGVRIVFTTLGWDNG